MKKCFAGALAFAVGMLMLGGTAGAAPPKNNETITITIDAASPNGPSPVTATGVFNGSGTETRTSRAAGKSVHATDVFTFDTGTVTVKDKGVRSLKLDKSTCTRQLSEKGVWKITSGTGAFAHAKGKGHYKATGTIQGVSGTNGCDFSAPTGTITVTATGKVK